MTAAVWNWSEIIPALPEVFLAVSAMFLLVLGACCKNGGMKLVCGLSLAALVAAIALTVKADWTAVTAFSGHFQMDGFGAYMKILVLGGLAATLMLSQRYLVQEGMGRFEYPVLLLLAGVGMMIMLSANSFLTLYVGLELQSLSFYVLAAIRRDNAKSSEAGLKYFVLGALASGMLLFGISLIYGYVGAVGFDAIADTLAVAATDGTVSPGAIIGMVFILVAIAFKVSAVPFHMWTPDVYEGAPTSVTALFAIVPKVAAIGLLIRVLFDPFAALMPDWQQVLWVLSAASMAWGGFAGIVQGNIKRLFAYSSIGNIGFALVGLVAGTADGVAASILYMTIYMIMTAGTFGIILMMRRNGVAVERITDLAGLSKTHPACAYAMTALMFSMSGIPPLAGFFGKLVVFQALIASGFYVLAVLGLVSSVVAAYYYLRIIKVMFFDDAEEPLDRESAPLRTFVLTVSIIFIAGFVIVPDTLMKTSKEAAAVLLPEND
jgi:NADH-quinone oxidoreductase subunit N